jgi:hypothetical protein
MRSIICSKRARSKTKALVRTICGRKPCLWTTSALLVHDVPGFAPLPERSAMGRIVFDDPWGTRWTARTRSDRHVPLDAEAARRRREPELLAQLGAVLAPTRQLVSTPLQGPHPGTGASREARHPAAVVGRLIGPDDALLLLISAVWSAARAMRADYRRPRVVELRSAGRIRRSATWRIATRENAVRAVASVADAVRRGHVPQLDDALLLEVVDERLPVVGALR